MKPRVIVVVSIDTEEDNWVPTRHGIQLENIRRLPHLQAEFDRAGVRATYFTTWQVLQRPWAADIIRGLSSSAEIGAHLHPWNTPPVNEPMVPRNTMMKNLAPDLQQAKLATLTGALTDVVGHAPTSFRAGRFGIGPETMRALVACGYTVDSSVMPFVSWEGMDEGPNFIGAPINCYRVAPGRSVIEPVADGAIVELPLSCAFNRGPFELWSRTRQILTSRPLQRLHASGLAARLGLGRRILISPEATTVRDMVLVAGALVRSGAKHLQVFFHSPSLMQGLTPFSEMQSQTRAILPSIQRFLEAMERVIEPLYMTVGEAAEALCDARGAGRASPKPRPYPGPVRISQPVVDDSVYEPVGNWAWMIEKTGGRALCVGDPTGAHLAALRQRFAHVVAIDRRPAHTRVIGASLERHGISGVSFVEGWLPGLPVEDAGFDCVAIPGLFERWPMARTRREGREALVATLREARRVLRPGGTLFISLPNRRRTAVQTFDPIGAAIRAVRGSSGDGVHSSVAAAEPWVPSPRSVERALHACGFREVQSFYGEPSHNDVARLIPRSSVAAAAFERAQGDAASTVREMLARTGLHALLYGSLLCFARA